MRDSLENGFLSQGSGKKKKKEKKSLIIDGRSSAITLAGGSLRRVFRSARKGKGKKLLFYLTRSRLARKENLLSILVLPS